MSQDKVVLIMGAGTVGNRSADVLLSLGIPVVLCKYDASPEDIKTQELKALFERYASSEVGKRMTTYAARGSRVEERAKNLEKYVGLSRVMGFTMLVSVVDVILITAISTLGAFLYNLSAALLGGIEVTLAEDN